MNGQPWGRQTRFHLPAPGRHAGGWPLAATWLIAGMLVVSHARLPDPPTGHPVPQRQQATTCWVVRVEPAVSLRRDERRLRSAGLPATLRPGERPGRPVLIVPAGDLTTARAARSKAVRLGFTRATVLRLPPAACRH